MDARRLSPTTAVGEQPGTVARCVADGRRRGGLQHQQEQSGSEAMLTFRESHADYETPGGRGHGDNVYEVTLMPRLPGLDTDERGRNRNRHQHGRAGKRADVLEKRSGCERNNRGHNGSTMMLTGLVQDPDGNAGRLVADSGRRTR